MMYEVSMSVNVVNESDLLDSAIRTLVKSDGLTEEQAKELLIEDGEIDVSNCLKAVVDPGVSWPGTSIIETSAEAY